MYRSLACLAFFALSATPAAAAVLHVNSATGTNAGTCTSPSTPCRTVTYAMAQAASGSPGDEIRVAPGTYDTTLGEVFPVVVKPGVQLRSTSGAATTILDASGSNMRVLELTNANADTLVEGLTITGGRPQANFAERMTVGGGMTINGGAPTIRGNVFHHNRAHFFGSIVCVNGIGGRGGAIHAVNAAAIIVNNVFRSNLAVGSYAEGCGSYSQPGAHGGAASGGAIYLEGVGAAISSNTFYLNAAIGGDGSNPYLQPSPGSGGTGSHGAVYANGASLSNNIFASNSSQGGRLAGVPAAASFGALQAVNPSAPFSNNLFVNNVANGVASTDDTVGAASVCTAPSCAGAHFRSEPNDLRITPQSPAVGAGTATGAPANDLAGVARPNPPSIGAFEPSAVGNPTRAVNIATRAHVGTGDDVMIGGFTIYGSTPKTVVVRARGPSLAQFGVSGVLANPQLTLYSGQTPIASNTDWQSAGNSAQIQASGFAPTHPSEAAILTTLQPGGYTAIVSGEGATTGVAIVEVFEVDAVTTPLVNVSTRARVLTGDSVMIAGFIIEGDGPQSVAIRVRGLSIVGHISTGVLLDPSLSLYSGQTLIAHNGNWRQGNAAAVETSGFAPAYDQEAALVTTLQPGAYTVVVVGADGGTGVAIVEVFKY